MGAAQSTWNNLSHLQQAKRAAMVAGYPDSKEGRKNSRSNGWSLRVAHMSQEAFDLLVEKEAGIKGRVG